MTVSLWRALAWAVYRSLSQRSFTGWDKLVVMATQVAHEGSDMTVYEVGHNMKEYCRFLESYDMTLESVIAKVMWMLGNYDISSCDIEEVFYHSINYDLIFGKNRKCN